MRYRDRVVLVHTRDDVTYQGVLVGAYVDVLALVHAVELQPAPRGAITTTPLSGDLLIPRDNVRSVQVPDVPRPAAALTPGGAGSARDGAGRGQLQRVGSA